MRGMPSCLTIRCKTNIIGSYIISVCCHAYTQSERRTLSASQTFCRLVTLCNGLLLHYMNTNGAGVHPSPIVYPYSPRLPRARACYFIRSAALQLATIQSENRATAALLLSAEGSELQITCPNRASAGGLYLPAGCWALVSGRGRRVVRLQSSSQAQQINSKQS